MYPIFFHQESALTLHTLQDCGLLLDAKVKGREIYPHKNNIFCLKCNRKQISSDESSDGSDAEN